MMTLIREGGWPMWVLLAFGLANVVVAALYAARPARGLGLVAGLSGTTLATTLMGVCMDLGAVGHHINERWEQYVDYPPARAVMQGVAESMSPAIVGFAVLAMVALLVGVGRARESYLASS